MLFLFFYLEITGSAVYFYLIDAMRGQKCKAISSPLGESSHSDKKTTKLDKEFVVFFLHMMFSQ